MAGSLKLRKVTRREGFKKIETKQRLDQILVEKGYFVSRQAARAAIMAGQVKVNGQKIFKPGYKLGVGACLEVACPPRYVSRGGLKLAWAIRNFKLDLQNKVIMDVGASTGGFTDCALQHGAKLVFAVDVGYGQLAWKLRVDPRVVVLERTNIRYLTPEKINGPVDFVTIDVSFISLTKVLPVLEKFLSPSAQEIALIKPQFEAGRHKVGKKGVIKDPLVHQEVITNICRTINKLGWGVKGLDFSPLTGPAGNIEYLVWFNCEASNSVDLEKEITKVVEKAHLYFK
jgi:23S rRNA (cytidine1920-2'-O)/16S rRNA (cytidine1409-2'-O)-methyltransferase